MSAEVHPTAVVHEGTILGDGVRVLEHAVVGGTPGAGHRVRGIGPLRDSPDRAVAKAVAAAIAVACATAGAAGHAGADQQRRRHRRHFSSHGCLAPRLVPG